MTEDVSLRPPGVAGRLAEMSVVMTVAIIAVPVLAAIICHEVAHGAVAYTLGDPTAGRRLIPLSPGGLSATFVRAVRRHRPLSAVPPDRRRQHYRKPAVTLSAWFDRR